MDTAHELCRQPLHPEAQRGIKLFNSGLYFEAHEALENAWRSETSPIRDLYRGILQVGVGYYHLQQGNYIGACKMFQRAKAWLSIYPSPCCGINLDQFKNDASQVEQLLLRLGPTQIHLFDSSLFKPIQMHVENKSG